MKEVAVGGVSIDEIFQGSMGIKTVALGDEILFTRPGGYFYLELDSKGDVSNG